MIPSPDAAPSAGLTPHDWIQLEQAAIGCTSGIENWPALRTAIQKVVANKPHSDALRRLVTAAKATIASMCMPVHKAYDIAGLWELREALAAMEAGGEK